MNEPVAWMHQNPDYAISKHQSLEYNIPLYTQDQLEEARKLGMQQERALWNLSTSTQEIMDTHSVKELTDEEIDKIENAVYCKTIQKGKTQNEYIKAFARAILRKASEK